MERKKKTEHVPHGWMSDNIITKWRMGGERCGGVERSGGVGWCRCGGDVRRGGGVEEAGGGGVHTYHRDLKLGRSGGGGGDYGGGGGRGGELRESESRE